MTFREKLADWISGGALTRVMAERHEYYQDMVHHINALYTITAQETPSANATVKRMARIAREALK